MFHCYRAKAVTDNRKGCAFRRGVPVIEKSTKSIQKNAAEKPQSKIIIIKFLVMPKKAWWPPGFPVHPTMIVMAELRVFL